MYRDANRNKQEDRIRSPRFLRKFILCIIGIVILSLMVMNYKDPKGMDKKGPYVSVKEVLPTMKAFISIQALNLSNQKESYENITKEFEESDSQYLTYGDLLRLLSLFPIDDISLLEEYKSENWYIGLEDWNGILLQLIERYGNKEIVVKDTMILGLHGNIRNEEQEFLKEDMVLTEKGIFQNEYWNINDFLLSNVRAVFYDDRILTIIEHSDYPGKIRNIFLADIMEEEVQFFYDGYYMMYPLEVMGITDTNFVSDNLSKKVTDIGIQYGKINLLSNKQEYIHGKLLQVSEDYMEIEGHGVYPLDEEMKIYRLYKELASMEPKDLRLGYSFTDFVIENGKIIACLMIKEEDMKYIRVLLKNSNYAGMYHELFEAVCDRDCEIIHYENGMETKRQKVKAGEEIIIRAEEINKSNVRIKVVPSVLLAKTTIKSIQRSQGIPAYLGYFEIAKEEDGLIIINEVLLEDYLCKVVPSEMPSGYPKEALMVQAVCARTYAYGKMIKAGLPAYGAHVDDSSGFQVYNNIDEQMPASEAVKATHNQILVLGGEPIDAYYYSTSCGVGADTGVWHGNGEMPMYLQAKEIGEESAEAAMVDLLTEEKVFKEWITGKKDSHYEAKEGWYRWTYTVEELDVSHMEEVLKSRYKANPELILTKNTDGEYYSEEIGNLGEIYDIEITKRIAGGVADEMIITGENAIIKVLSELNIRYVLSDGKTKAVRQTNDEADISSLLPSAFIVLKQEKEEGILKGIKVIGGGFGHGVGMSQNGAKNMANKGMTHKQIIEFFYPGTELKILQSGD